MNPHELAALIDEHAAALGLLARSICDCADDVVQEAFVEFVRQNPPPTNAKAWLFRTVRNRAISAWRQASRRRRRESEAAAGSQAWFESGADEAIDAQAAVAMLRELATDLRDVTVLKIWGDLTFREIGEVLAISDSTAQRRFAAALETLREKLNPPCPNITTIRPA